MHCPHPLPVQPFQVTAPCAKGPWSWERWPGAAQRLGTLPSYLSLPPVPSHPFHVLSYPPAHSPSSFPFCYHLSPHILSHVPPLFPSHAFLSCHSFSLRLEITVSAAAAAEGLGFEAVLEKATFGQQWLVPPQGTWHLPGWAGDSRAQPVCNRRGSSGGCG